MYEEIGSAEIALFVINMIDGVALGGSVVFMHVTRVCVPAALRTRRYRISPEGANLGAEIAPKLTCY